MALPPTVVQRPYSSRGWFSSNALSSSQRTAVLVFTTSSGKLGGPLPLADQLNAATSSLPPRTTTSFSSLHPKPVFMVERIREAGTVAAMTAPCVSEPPAKPEATSKLYAQDDAGCSFTVAGCDLSSYSKPIGGLSGPNWRPRYSVISLMPWRASSSWVF